MTTETPSQSILRNDEVCASLGRSSRPQWKTPQRKALKTPRSLRLFASAGPKTPHERTPSYSYEGLLHKTWRVHSLSPLFQFNTSSVSLKQYGRSLDLAFSKGTFMTDKESTQSHFEIYHGLSFHEDDPDAIRIQVTEKQIYTDQTEKVVLTAFLCCVDLEDSGVLEAALSKSFTYYPLVLVGGNKQRADILMDWLQRHFDCHSSPMEFSDFDLRWFLSLGCRQDGGKPHPILMQYNLKEVCDGINTIDFKFESPFCKEVWDKMQENSDNEEFLTENQVSLYVSALENHLEYTMHLTISKLSLNEVGTPICYVSRDGKLKILDSRGVYVILHMICEVISCKYVQGLNFCG